MVAKLLYSTGDPDYLKVVVLFETLNISDLLLSKQEGELYLEIVHVLLGS